MVRFSKFSRKTLNVWLMDAPTINNLFLKVRSWRANCIERLDGEQFSTSIYLTCTSHSHLEHSTCFNPVISEPITNITYISVVTFNLYYYFLF